jgi:hypothetical protein
MRIIGFRGPGQVLLLDISAGKIHLIRSVLFVSALSGLYPPCPLERLGGIYDRPQRSINDDLERLAKRPVETGKPSVFPTPPKPRRPIQLRPPRGRNAFEEIAMKFGMAPTRTVSLAACAAFALLALTAAAPASAQVACPPGYVYNGYGCIYYSPAYGAPYGVPGYDYPSPAYDVFGLGLGFGGGGHRGGGGGHGFGGGHGGGGHAGGGGGHAGGGGGGHGGGGHR